MLKLIAVKPSRAKLMKISLKLPREVIDEHPELWQYHGIVFEERAALRISNPLLRPPPLPSNHFKHSSSSP
jgi:hypothetical protein